jgi:hypothetical protein
MADESIRRWAHYSTEALERLLAEVEAENGRALASLLAELRSEIDRRREESHEP